MFEFGDIVFVTFPFTDLSGAKLRPALVISRDNEARDDIVLAFITSRNSAGRQRDALSMAPTPENGLRVPSFVRFDKLVTLKRTSCSAKPDMPAHRGLHPQRPFAMGCSGSNSRACSGRTPSESCHLRQAG